MLKNILVVDNHPVILEFMSNLLMKEGHRVKTAEDGLCALDVLKDYTPDIIFVDLIMPNIGGDKLCRIIRTMPQLKDAHLVILSGIAVDEEVDFVSLGANACIAKGPLAHMTKHVLATVKQSCEGSFGTGQQLTMGVETLHPRQVTKELLAVKRHFEIVLESMTEGIVEVTRDGRIVYANPAALSLTGMTEGELLTTSLVELFAGRDRQRLQGLLAMISSSRQCLFDDIPFMLEGRQVSVKILPVKEEFREAIVMFTDITTQKQMEKQLQQAKTMEAIDTLAGGVTHAFNNALTVIIGNISLAKLYAKPDDPVSQKLEEAERASLKARDLTQQLLPFSDRSVPMKKAASVARALKRSCLTTLTGGDIRCQIMSPDDLWIVSADMAQIEQVINIVVNNAAEAMSWRGTIKASAENFTLRDDQSLPLQPGRYVKVSISDRGPGIHEEDLFKIYDPYFTTKEMGRGLGLTKAYSIIHHHDGFITARSEPGAGTTFEIYLPAVESEVETRTDSAVTPVTVACDQGKVLLMDDDENVREIVGGMLNSLGYSTRFASDGGEAIILYLNAQEMGDPFDVVILDMNISCGMGGVETVQNLLRVDPHAKAIVTSGSTADPVMLQCRRFGFKGALEKPFKLGELSSVLEKVIMGESEGRRHPGSRL